MQQDLHINGKLVLIIPYREYPGLTLRYRCSICDCYSSSFRFLLSNPDPFKHGKLIKCHNRLIVLTYLFSRS